MSSKQAQGKRVAVIGAGAAGLIAAKCLLAEGLNVTIYERKSEVGGLWNSYDAIFPTNAYDNLETNVPRHLMTFSGQPWRMSTPMFPGKDDVAGYLQSLAGDLLTKSPNGIKLRRRREVISLRHVSQYSGLVGWEIIARNREMDVINREADMITYETDEFDLVVVSNGIYTKEFIPTSYEGIQAWRVKYGRTESHVKTFRNTSNFRGKTVLVVGNSASGWDVSEQLVGVASSVTVSTRRAGQDLSHPSQIKKGPIRRFLAETGEVGFEDGTLSRFDKILWCTGYTYDLAFVKNDANGQIFTEDFRVTNTYEHMFYIPPRGDPNLAFVGLLKMVPWTVLELQGSLIAKVFAGRERTPSRRDMRAWEWQAIADWTRQCTVDPSLDRMFHALNRGPLPHAMTGTQVNTYMNRLYHWITRSAVAQPSLNAGPNPPLFCVRLDWIRINTGRVRTVVSNAGVGRSEVDRLALRRVNARLVDYEFNMETNCHCSGEDALCKTAFAFDDQ